MLRRCSGQNGNSEECGAAPPDGWVGEGRERTHWRAATRTSANCWNHNSRRCELVSVDVAPVRNHGVGPVAAPGFGNTQYMVMLLSWRISYQTWGQSQELSNQRSSSYPNLHRCKLDRVFPAPMQIARSAVCTSAN